MGDPVGMMAKEEDAEDDGVIGVGEDDDYDDEGLASFLENHLLSADHLLQQQPLVEEEQQQQEEEEEEEENSNFGKVGESSNSSSPPPANKRRRFDHDEEKSNNDGKRVVVIDTGSFTNIPPELFLHIFKFLSSEDLISCALVCRFMNLATSDETLWRRLYCMRWGCSSTGKLRECSWKKLYIQRDKEDMVEFVRNTPLEFKEYYIQMQSAKRSQAPLPSQVNDDQVILDRTVADQVSIWKSSRGITDEAIIGHVCSGNTCSYSQIGDLFICEKTGRVHVCDDTCREVVLDQSSGLLVCTISGHCFDRWLCPEEEPDISDDQLQGDVTDEVEPSLGLGRFARAYLLGYNCADEKELRAALRFC